MTTGRRPLRVLYVCHDGDLFGSQRSLALIASHGRDIDVTPIVSVARDGPLQARLAQIPGLTLARHRRLQWIKHDARTPLRRAGDLLGLALASAPRAMALAALARRHRVDLIHTNSLVSLEGALAAQWAGLAHVWHIREIFASDNPKVRPTLGAAGTRLLLERLSTRLICISQAVAAQFSPAASPRIHVIANAVEDARAPATGPPPLWPRSPQRLRIGYVGRLSAGKRFLDLLDALAHLGPQAPVELAVAGKCVDAAYERQVRERLARSDIGDRVRMAGVLEDLAPFYASLDVLTLPSKDEAFGRVLIEAMAAGVPCVGADSGGIPEIIEPERTGFLYPCGDARALAQVWERCLRERNALETLGNNARRAVAQRFTIETQMRALRECYDAALQ